MSGLSAIGIVPARAGSKGVPDKNIQRVGDRSLLELAVAVGVDCAALSAVYVSTDSPDYLAMAEAAGAVSNGLRPAALASDTAKTVDVVLDLLDRLDQQPDALVLLQPTAPMRTPIQIEQALALLGDADAVVSVCRLEEPHPAKLKRIGGDGLLYPFLDRASSEQPRQALPPVYRLTGAIYAIRVTAIRAARSFFPPRVRPLATECGINVDTPDDLLMLRTLWELGRLELHGLPR